MCRVIDCPEMEEIKKYIEEVLGLEVVIEPVKPAQLKRMPVYMQQGYAFYQARLFGRDIVFLKNKSEEIVSADRLRKHLFLAEQVVDCPGVFVFPFLESYNRQRLIRKQVAFVVPGKQLFIPQLLIDLRDFRQTVAVKREKLLPAAQCILFYHLLIEDIESFPLKTVAQKTGYTRATVTRALQSLVDKEIAAKRVENKEVKIRFPEKGKDLWQRALPVLQSPVKKRYFLEGLPPPGPVYHAGFSALTRYTDLSEGSNRCFAIAQKDFAELKKKKQLHIIPVNEHDICLEIWKYAPAVLAKDDTVDPLSLYLTLKEEKDERVEMELEKMIERLW